MSAKKNSPRPNATPTPAAAMAASGTPAVSSGAAAEAGEPSWIDSPDPRRRMIAKIVLVGIWIYVAALWLLALDQWFNWGIFGPKIPPVP